MALNNFAYDAQIRRFLLQFIRFLSNFQVEFGKDENGFTTLQQVPVIYGDQSRQAAAILRGGSENATPTVPCIGCYITGLDYDRNRVQEPFHIGKLQIRERAIDHTTGQYGHNQGDAFSVERMMPVPYKLTLKADIWTSNTEQKCQLMEQILPLFNPSMEIQSTDNYIDWTSLTVLTLIGTNWSSRSVGTSNEDAIDIATLTFELPIWLSLPAKVKRLGVIEKLVANIFDVNGDLINDIADLPDASILSRKVFTPMDFSLLYMGNALKLYHLNNIVRETIDTIELSNQTEFSWKTYIELLGGNLKSGISKVMLDQPTGGTVVGTVAYHPTDPTLLLFTPYGDTSPTNSMPPINAIIDPYNMPVDSTYLNAATGTRFLILNAIGSPDNLESAIAWRGSDGVDLVADANDIIEFDGAHWAVAFHSADAEEVKYVTNLKSGLQFKWTPEEQQWSKSIEGQYNPGDWTLVV